MKNIKALKDSENNIRAWSCNYCGYPFPKIKDAKKCAIFCKKIKQKNK
jgi:rubrerythrin